MPDAFKHQDKMRVPLVWQHSHDTPENVLGHVLLEHRPDGIFGYGFFNETDKAQHAYGLLEHEDINMMSIWANQLVERSGMVLHGSIREVSLVLAGANPGAVIESVSIRHSDGTEDELEDEARIFSGDIVEHAAGDDDENPSDGESVQDVFDTLNEKQKMVVHFMIGEALDAGKSTAGHSTMTKSTEDNAGHGEQTKEGSTMTRNVFEKGSEKVGTVLSHDDMKMIVEDAAKSGSLKSAVEGYALKHGIEDIETLFPDAHNVTDTPDWISRRMEWVAGWLGGTKKTPFGRIKSMSADLTFEDARAKGYIKGTLKKEQFFGVAKRVTTPQTVYKKQKLDRDDIIDITDFDVVVWVKGEMRIMLDEEIARASLIGDGREVDDEDKIQEDKIRPIATDDEFYVTYVNVNINDANSNMGEVIDAIILNRQFYKGSGRPNLYTTETYIAQFLLMKDGMQRRMYRTMDELATELRVNAIIAVEVLEDDPDVVAIIVNPADYTFGADKGGQVAMFDDFDIDYNQYKYLIETRCCGALTKPKSAIVVKKTAGTNVLASPTAPTFVEATGALTIPTVTGVVYKHGATVVNAAGNPYSVPNGQSWVIDATPASGYYFGSSDNDQWEFENPA
jgi:hypothetical protein